MAQPKRRTPRSRKNSRIRANKKPSNAVNVCGTCGGPALSHRVCTACGSYNGRQVITVSVDD